MKNFTYFLPLVMAAFMWQGCIQDKCTSKHTYIKQTPIYKGYEEVKASVASENPREITDPGKIYYKDDYIFVNEINKGIHIIDASNPSNPQNISFINLPGNLDLSIMGDVLYADCFTDLVAIDLSNLSDIEVLNWEEEVFPNRIWFNGFQAPQDSGLIVGWKEEEVTDTFPCNSGPYFRNGFHYENNSVFMTADVATNLQTANMSTAGAGGGVSSPGSGTGGSMARFTISSQYLYAIDQVDLHVFDLSDIQDPQFVRDVTVEFNIETIFPYQDYLFIGGQTGVFIYDNSDPRNPARVSEFTHANSCDPVVVQDDIAYVTLRDGSQCAGFTNQLDVIDVSDIQNPTLIESYPMSNPHGLGVDGNNLFICDGDAGLKVFDNQDLQNITNNMLDQVRNGEKYIDIIPLGSSKYAIVMTDEGICLWDYQDPSALVNLSCLPVITS